MVKQLSIIIPLYNLEDHIERCILSIVNQSIDSDHYELIVINDGSTDKSQPIVERLQSDYPFIQLINKKNGGLSSARNKGLDVASGKYIFFIDADDWIVPDSLSVLLRTITEQSTGIILFNVSEVYPNREARKINFHLPQANKILLVEDYMCKYTIQSAAWQGLFKRYLFTDYNIRMPEGLLAEDDDLSVKLFSVAETIYYVPVDVYNYYQRPQSISNSSDSIHNEKLIEDRIFIFKELVNYTQSFSGKRKIGLDRKLNFLALDIIRLLIRKSHTKQTIDSTLQELSTLGYFPLVKISYSTKYRLIRYLLNNRSRIYFLATIKKSEKFF